MNQYLDIAPEVAAALQARQPVVALESTIVAHGMPYPQNLETAQIVESIIREGGAVPATIAILDGRLKVGLSPDELQRVAQSPDMVKASIRDLAVLVASGGNGATTVASTMRIAAMAGIHVFVTGGIGGVHRGAAKSFDISADLEEMAESNVAVVCAGAKSILDIGLTLEYLETAGVPVITVGSETFPAFYSRESGHKSPFTVANAAEVAAIARAKWEMGLKGGMVIANPIAVEDEIPAEEIDRQIQGALIEADTLGYRGKTVTPFLLKHVATLTEGRSLTANIALVRNNARLGAAIAVALAG
ncbi:pseudouridine-5'-phosphate glycosidase [Dongia rigui]|uniref:Pseudouridine-5'-phosphate glycosidase n=1 Tax=Dongia rigui TaxID=940149 RepID=A0ABU5DVF8_9PROT|nr:pseudouridine-5'-phosphate glycosidase [Dongia rigui]MDY0871198.1 pseudouridine-5'-phosphate glycosidase [Dongia rigui]